MKSNKMPWTKAELHAYIYLLCADADSVMTEEEMQLIRSKVDPEIFEKIYKEFKKDSGRKRLKKIERNIELHEYSLMELAELRKEMHQIFASDEKYHMKEQILDEILDNILY
jgi:signal recognition particle GTPase